MGFGLFFWEIRQTSSLLTIHVSCKSKYYVSEYTARVKIMYAYGVRIRNAKTIALSRFPYANNIIKLKHNIPGYVLYIFDLVYQLGC